MYASPMSQSLEVRLGVSDARANLTEVIAKVRLLGQRVVFTRRDKPQAVLVSYEFYERALVSMGETAGPAGEQQQTG
ncbi:prevent-host-death family protein [Actinobacteria bacterium OV450]|nr:prevent-host-death family protein [Actinobacteria bacterium OV450]